MSRHRITRTDGEPITLQDLETAAATLDDTKVTPPKTKRVMTPAGRKNVTTRARVDWVTSSPWTVTLTEGTAESRAYPDECVASWVQRLADALGATIQ